MKERSFRFSADSPARVTCRHCGWTSVGHRTPMQEVFDRSARHECAGVESYASMRARTDAANTRTGYATTV